MILYLCVNVYGYVMLDAKGILHIVQKLLWKQQYIQLNICVGYTALWNYIVHIFMRAVFKRVLNSSRPNEGYRKQGHHWFRWWLVTYKGPSHYLNQCCIIVNLTLGNNYQWNFDQNATIFIQESGFQSAHMRDWNWSSLMLFGHQQTLFWLHL